MYFLRHRQIEAKLDHIVNLLHFLIRKEISIMATLQETLDKVTEQTTVVDGLSALTYQIKAMLDAALSKELTPEQQAKVDAIFAGLQANNDKAAKALLDNTPQAPPVP
jgi:hypothetical protein